MKTTEGLIALRALNVRPGGWDLEAVKQSKTGHNTNYHCTKVRFVCSLQDFFGRSDHLNTPSCLLLSYILS